MINKDSVKQLFEKALAIKEQRGENYDNSNKSKSAYELSLQLFELDSAGQMIGIWPVAQKLSRLITLARAFSDSEEPLTSVKKQEIVDSMEDNVIDLINYAGMYYEQCIEPNKIPDEEKTVGELKIDD